MVPRTSGGDRMNFAPVLSLDHLAMLEIFIIIFSTAQGNKLVMCDSFTIVGDNGTVATFIRLVDNSATVINILSPT